MTIKAARPRTRLPDHLLLLLGRKVIAVQGHTGVGDHERVPWLDCQPGLQTATVLERTDHGVVLAGSPFKPARDGLVGDTGVVGRHRVSYVTRVPEGLLHILRDGSKARSLPMIVSVQVDLSRRGLVARSHSLGLLVCDALRTLGTRPRDLEVEVDRAWVEATPRVTRGAVLDAIAAIARASLARPEDLSEPHVSAIEQIGRFHIGVIGRRIDMYLVDSVPPT